MVQTTISERNRKFQQKSAEVIVVGRNESASGGKVSQTGEGLNIELFQML